MSCFELAIPFVLRDEGGFSADPRDPGNWTGGKVNVGELKGTKFGISAASYPNLDIVNLTLDHAKEIYRRDFWNANDYGRIYNQSVANKIFNLCVNMGDTQAHKLVQRAIWAIDMDTTLVDDGVLGNKTIMAINTLNASLLPPLRSEQAGFYRLIVALDADKKGQLNGWLKRSYNL